MSVCRCTTFPAPVGPMYAQDDQFTVAIRDDGVLSARHTGSSHTVSNWSAYTWGPWWVRLKVRWELRRMKARRRPRRPADRLIPRLAWMTLALSTAVGILFMVSPVDLDPPVHELAAVSLPGMAASTLILMSRRWAALDMSALALGLALVYTFLPVQPEVMLGISHWYFPIAMFTSGTALWNFMDLWINEEDERMRFRTGAISFILKTILGAAVLYILFRFFVWWWQVQ